MRAVMLHEFGPPRVLVPVELADPVAGPDQVLIDVAFVNITFVETQIRAGRAPNPAMLPPLPAILGNGVAGIVAAVGDGVDSGLVGSRVITSTGGTSGYAELVTVPTDGLIPVPDTLGLDDAAAALLADGRTAMALARATNPQTGETVLIEAAAGGVGSLLVQLAKNAECRVIAAASTPAKLNVARRLGADLTVNYQEPGWTTKVRAEAGGVDVVYDGVGGRLGQDAFALLGPSGRYCAFGMASGTFAPIPKSERRDIQRISLTPPPPGVTRELTQAALTQAVNGGLHPLIGQRFPLHQAADAHAAIEARTTIGKTLLIPGPPRPSRPPSGGGFARCGRRSPVRWWTSW